MDYISHLHWTYIATIIITMVGYLIALLLIPKILMDRRGVEATLAWILLIFFLPYIGVALYYLIGRTRIRRRTRKKIKSRKTFRREMKKVPDIPPELEDGLGADLHSPARTLAALSRSLNGTTSVSGNKAEIFIDGKPAFESMEAAIMAASHHVHLMSYVFRNDTTGRHFLDILTEKAAQGVEVRLLVDGFGGYGLDKTLIQPLLDAGGQFGEFLPITRRKGRWRPILRNHRKILVVDNRIGFTGGLNIGDEYQGRMKKHAPWRDTHLRLEGPAVRDLQEIFAEDWFFATDEDLGSAEYFATPEPAGSEIVQIMASGPDHDMGNIHHVFFTAINEARRRVFITTPYFIPDPPIRMAMKSAAYRGVDIRLLVPGQSDLRLVQIAGKSYYEELLEAGVQIYEHRPGILHAKTMVVDSEWSTIGSANMDTRSFQLNFEANVLIWGRDFASKMEGIFLNDLQGSRHIDLAGLADKKKHEKLLESVARMLSPVL